MRLKFTVTTSDEGDPGLVYITRSVPAELEKSLSDVLVADSKWLAIRNQKGEAEYINLNRVFMITELKDND